MQTRFNLDQGSNHNPKIDCLMTKFYENKRKQFSILVWCLWGSDSNHAQVAAVVVPCSVALGKDEAWVSCLGRSHLLALGDPWLWTSVVTIGGGRDEMAHLWQWAALREKGGGQLHGGRELCQTGEEGKRLITNGERGRRQHSFLEHVPFAWHSFCAPHTLQELQVRYFYNFTFFMFVNFSIPHDEIKNKLYGHPHASWLSINLLPTKNC